MRWRCVRVCVGLRLCVLVLGLGADRAVGRAVRGVRDMTQHVCVSVGGGATI